MDRAPWEIAELLRELVVERFGGPPTGRPPFLHGNPQVRRTDDPQAVDGTVRMTFAELIAAYERERPPTPWEYAHRRKVLIGHQQGTEQRA